MNTGFSLHRCCLVLVLVRISSELMRMRATKLMTEINHLLFLKKSGAVNAMQDSVVLANCIYNMPDASRSSITGAFEEYYRQRYPLLDSQYKRSQTMMSVMGGKVSLERLWR
jgi:hypothetical protein